MARCKLTSMNLRTIRKSREYQALLIDLVAMGVVGQSAAEGVLGYTIPAGLLGNTSTDDDDEPGTGEGTGGEGTGGEGTGGETGGETELTPIVMDVQISVNNATPITVGTFTIPADTEATTLSEICDTLEGPFDDSYFTPNENWSSDYTNSDNYTIGQAKFEDPDDDFAQVPISTALAELPANTLLYIPISSNSSSSSS